MALFAYPCGGWKRLNGGPPMTRHWSMKALTYRLSCVGGCRFPGWERWQTWLTHAVSGVPVSMLLPSVRSIHWHSTQHHIPQLPPNLGLENIIHHCLQCVAILSVAHLPGTKLQQLESKCIMQRIQSCTCVMRTSSCGSLFPDDSHNKVKKKSKFLPHHQCVRM